MCLLLETVQIKDGIVLNATYHEKRMTDSSLALNGRKVDFSFSILIIPAKYQKDIVKCRILYKSQVESIEFESYKPKKINSLKLVLNDEITYSHKYADRSPLIELIKLRGRADDILIVKKGQITDTSYSNVVFQKANEYYTPSTYLLNGTKRRQLLDRGLIREEDISPKKMSSMDSIILINSMLDLDSGVKINIDSIIF